MESLRLTQLQENAKKNHTKKITKKKFQFVDILSTNMPFWNQKFQYLGYAIGSMKIMFFPNYAKCVSEMLVEF